MRTRSGSGPCRKPSTTSTSGWGSNLTSGGDRARAVVDLAARLGLHFRDLTLLEQALVHSSFVNEHPDSGLICNERLEFLGDAVVSLVFSEALYERYEADDEGFLTTRRAAIVSRPGLAHLANKIELGSYLRVGEGAERAGERRRPSVLAAALEAVVGAIYLDLGLDVARARLLSLAEDELNAEAPAAAFKAAKSRLQELSYARTGRPPEYRILSAEGPDHAKQYRVEVLLGGVPLATGEGSNRRAAETEAAARALAVLTAGESRDARDAGSAVAGIAPAGSVADPTRER